MPQRRGWSGAAQAGFGFASDMIGSYIQNLLAKERQLEVGQQYIDANQDAREYMTVQRNQEANILAGLPPDTSPEERARHVAQTNAMDQFNQAAQDVADVDVPVAPRGEPNVPFGPDLSKLTAMSSAYAHDPVKQAFIRQRLGGYGLQPSGPDAPTSGQTAPQAVPQGMVGSLAMPQEQFARDAAAQAATQKRVAELDPGIVDLEAGRAQSMRPGPDELGAGAEAQRPSIERLRAEAEARAAGAAAGTPEDPPEGPSQAQAEAASFYARAAAATSEMRSLAPSMMALGVFAPLAGEASRTFKIEADEFIRAVLRKESGAAITHDDQQMLATALPSALDTPEMLERKFKVQEGMLETMRSEAGGAPIPEIGGRTTLPDDEILRKGDAGEAMTPDEMERYIQLVGG